MIKFLAKFSILGTFLAIVLFFCNYAYVHTNYYQNLNGIKEKFSNIPEHIDVVNFGASHSAGAFDWSSYEEFNGVNMALGSQTLVYDEALFDYYYERFDQDSLVIFEIMFKSLYETETSEKPYPPYITRYYQILPGKYIRHWNLKDALCYQYLPILGNRQEAIYAVEQEAVSNLKMKGKNTDNVVSNIENVSDEPDKPTQVLTGYEMDAMIAEGQKTAQAFMKQSGSWQLGEEYQALIRMIEKCKKKDIQILLVTVPTLPCFYEAFPEEFIEKFYYDINAIASEYKIPYRNYTGDERFLADYRWYYNTNHFGKKGAKIFTKQFIQDNKEIFNTFQK